MKFGLYSLLVLASSASAAKTTTTAAAAATTTSLNAALTSTTSISVASGCSFSKTLTATAQSDLDALAGCEAVEGDIEITGDLGSASIANVKAIYGDLSIFNATNLVSFAADSLTTITGQLELQSLTVLSSLSFGQLSNIGAINWVTLPNLIDTGLHQVTECNSIYISDTQLSSLDGLDPTDVETFNVNNNFNLVSISSNIVTISNALSIAYNGENTEVTFDELIWANNLTFYSVSSISMESIVAINKSAGFFESYVEELNFPYVKSLGGDLTIENNEELREIDFGNLTTVTGGLVIVNNTELTSIDNLDSVTSVGGAVILKGDFDNCTMSSLKTVRGAFDLETTGYADCSPFKKLSSKGGIQGDYTCKAAKKAVSSSSSSKASKSSSSSADSSSAASSSTSTDDSSSSSSSSSSGTVSSISSTSKADAGSLKQASIFGTFGAILLALL